MGYSVSAFAHAFPLSFFYPKTPRLFLPCAAASSSPSHRCVSCAFVDSPIGSSLLPHPPEKHAIRERGNVQANHAKDGQQPSPSMSFYFFRFPSRQACVLGVLGGGTAAGAYGAWDVVRSRRNAVPLFDTAAIVRTEDSCRYPCTTLRGFDVVVRSFYVAAADPADTKSTTTPPGAGTTATTATTSTGAPSTSVSARFWRFVGLFSNATHTVSGVRTEGDVRQEAAAAVRVVVRDARDAAAVTAGESSPAAASLIAASRWPPHTAKYAALVLEPSAADASSPLSLPRSLLRQLVDGATHQTLVRCNPRSTLLDMACEADPAYLGAPYLRVLLSGFLLLPTTLSQLNVAVLGVGGGALPLFLQTYFASRLHRCDLVDVEGMCFRAAVEQMGLREPLNTVAARQAGGGVYYHVEDAVRFLRRRVQGTTGRVTAPPSASDSTSQAAAHGSIPVFDTAPSSSLASSLSLYSSSSATTATSSSSSRRPQLIDLLFVDLFVGSELDDAVTSLDFLQLCRHALSPAGVAAFNLPAADKAFVQRCAVVFGTPNVFRVPVPASSNEVVLVRGGAGGDGTLVGPELSHRHFYRRAQQLTAQYRLPYDLANHFPVWWRFW